jgi:hypothetical protein
VRHVKPAPVATQPREHPATAARASSSGNDKAAAGDPGRAQHPGKGSAHDCCFGQQAAADRLLRWGGGCANARQCGPSDTDRSVQHHPEGPLAPFRFLRRRSHVLHATDHELGCGALSGRPECLDTATLHRHAGSVRPSYGQHRPACVSSSPWQLRPQRFQCALFARRVEPVEPKRSSEEPPPDRGFRPQGLAAKGDPLWTPWLFGPNRQQRPTSSKW